MTAGHCVCSKPDTESNKQHVPCLSPSLNQIRPLGAGAIENQIVAYGGNDYSKMIRSGYRYKWNIMEAYYMDDSSLTKWPSYDVGIAIIPNTLPIEERFFNKKLHRNRMLVEQAHIIPVCLIDRGFDFTEKTLTGIGWGINYEEKPISDDPNARNPIYSTCMTNEDSPIGSRFQNCDMKEIKKRSWECEKKEQPPNYNKDKCQKLFEKAATQDTLTKLDSEAPSTSKRRKIDYSKSFNPPGAQGHLPEVLGNANVMYVKDPNGKIVETCYQETLLKDIGWCFIPSSSQPQKWGFCSRSCSELLMKASTL